ncbi:MAG: hypothetical protein AAFO81_13235 [Pseudomonadota bacterium]
MYPTIIRIAACLFAITILAACGGGGGGGDPVTPPPPPVLRTPETIAFSAADGVGINGATEMYVIRDDGNGLTQVSSDTARDTANITSFAISPDGQWVAYIADLASAPETALFVNSINGGTPLHVSRTRSQFGSRVNSFDWSPDSTQLVYAGSLDQTTINNQFASEVFVVNRDGTGDIKINGNIGTNASVEVRNPQWSPNGRYIVQEVASFDGQIGGGNAFALNVWDETLSLPNNSRRLMTSQTSVRNVRWAADSSRLSYTADQEMANEYHVYGIAVDGSGNVRATNNGDFNSDSKWSPTGATLAYLDNPNAPFPADLIVSGAAPGATDTVLVFLSPNNREVVDFAWSPDGSRLAYTSDEQTQNINELYVINADGSGNATKVSGPQTASSDVFEFAWSPDGSSIAYLSDAEANTFIDLYVTNVATGSVTVLSSGLPGEEVVDFAWSGDSERVAFSTGLEGRTPQANTLYVTQPDGTGRVEITEPMTGGPLSFEYD